MAFVVLQSLSAQEHSTISCDQGIVSKIMNMFSLDRKKASLLNDKGLKFYYRDDWQKAIEQYLQALDLTDEDYCLKLTGAIYHNIANAYDGMDQYEKAIAYQKKAIAAKRAISPGSTSLALSCRDLAKSYRAVARYKEAESSYREALRIYKVQEGGRGAQVANVYTGLGENARLSEDINRSFVWNKKAVGILEKSREDLSLLATAYNNLGLSYDEDNNYTQAISYYLKSIRYEERDSTEMAKTYNNIAAAYSALENFDKAIVYYQKALKIVKKVLGEDALYTAIFYNNIGTCYEDQGNFTAALGYLEKAYTGAKKILGEAHPDVKTLKENRDRVKRRLEQRDK